MTARDPAATSGWAVLDWLLFEDDYVFDDMLASTADQDFGSEPADDLAQHADVVDDRRHACSQHLQERAREIDLCAVREERDGRLGAGVQTRCHPGQLES